jgi:hypothetical protein
VVDSEEVSVEVAVVAVIVEVVEASAVVVAAVEASAVVVVAVATEKPALCVCVFMVFCLAWFGQRAKQRKACVRWHVCLMCAKLGYGNMIRTITSLHCRVWVKPTRLEWLTLHDIVWAKRRIHSDANTTARLGDGEQRVFDALMTSLPC